MNKNLDELSTHALVVMSAALDKQLGILDYDAETDQTRRDEVYTQFEEINAAHQAVLEALADRDDYQQ